MISQTGHIKNGENHTASFALSQDEGKIKQPPRSPTRNLVLFLMNVHSLEMNEQPIRMLRAHLSASGLSNASHGPDTYEDTLTFNYGTCLVLPSSCIKIIVYTLCFLVSDALPKVVTFFKKSNQQHD